MDMDMTRLDASRPGRNGPGNDDNEGVPHITQSSITIGALPSNCLVSQQDTRWWDSVGVFYSPSQLGKEKTISCFFKEYPYLTTTPLGQDMTQGHF